MNELYILLGIGVILASALLIVVFVVPTEKNIPRRKKKKRDVPQKEEKDWPKIVSRLEGKVKALSSESDKQAAEEKRLAKQILIEQAKIEKLEEKLKQEREWQEKDKQNFDKKQEEFKLAKKNLTQAEENYAKEHSLAIKLDKELNELKTSFQNLDENFKKLETKNTLQENTIKEQRTEILQLKKENAKIAKSKEDSMWVAKSEFVELDTQYKALQKELAKLKPEKNPPK